MWFYELFSSNPRTLCGVAVAFSRHAIYTLVIAFCNHIREAQFPSIIMDFAVRVRNIAQHAINNINQLAGLVDQSSMRSPSNCEEESEQAATARPRPSPNQPNPSSGQASAVSELRQRFPTVNRGSRRRDQRPIPYSRAASARSGPGRPPASEIITRDVIIMEMACEKIPTKTERQALERSKRIISGFDFDRQWNDKKLYQELQNLLPEGLKDIDFEIVKNSGGVLVKPNIPPNKSIDGKLLLKSISPSGAVYIRLLDELPDDSIDAVLDVPAFGEQITDTFLPENVRNDDVVVIADENPLPQQTPLENTSSLSPDDPKCPFPIEDIIKKGKGDNLVDPVEILRFLQAEIVQGRALEISSPDEALLAGETNFITVDRDQILKSTFSELEFVENLRFTFQVDFMGEESLDQGGPRKEWLILVMQEIKQKYFDLGLRPLLQNDYYHVGVMFALSLLQNGKIPSFLAEGTLQQIISIAPSDVCIKNFQKGLESLGMLSAMREFPMLVHLLRPNSQHRLSVQKLLQLLKPSFSEEGSNAFTKEKETYQCLVRYIREVAGGRRSCGDMTLDLGHILKFATGATEEPVLGFRIHPSIEFHVPNEVEMGLPQLTAGDGEAAGTAKVVPCFTPTAHTCINVLKIPRATLSTPMPCSERLYNIYDLAFASSYFGKQ